MIKIHIDITNEIIEQKLVNANYFKRLSYINILLEIAIYLIIEIINFSFSKLFDLQYIMPIIFRVNYSHKFRFLRF